MAGRKRIEQPDWPRLQFSLPPEYRQRILMYGAEHGLSIAEVVMHAVDAALPTRFGKRPTNKKRPKAALAS